MKVLTDTHTLVWALSNPDALGQEARSALAYVVRTRIPALAIRTAHIRALARLPNLHKDPFDRILIAQSLAEGLTLVSKDAILGRYGVPVIW